MRSDSVCLRANVLQMMHLPEFSAHFDDDELQFHVGVQTFGIGSKFDLKIPSCDVQVLW
jgi:hypothetical protein